MMLEYELGDEGGIFSDIFHSKRGAIRLEEEDHDRATFLFNGGIVFRH
jgi:hypothetical protein